MFVKIFSVLLLIAYASAIPRPQQNQQSNNTPDIADNNYRLPSSITPENYKLEIFTHLNDTEGFIFRGVVTIKVIITVPVDVCNLQHFPIEKKNNRK